MNEPRGYEPGWKPPATTYYVWRRSPDGYVGGTTYRPRDYPGWSYETLLETTSWELARIRIEQERAKGEVLRIMSCDHGRLDAYGGYKLLRSEYRLNQDSRLAETASEITGLWLAALRHILAGDMVSARKAHVTVHDLYVNGDILDEDIEVFARVLTRYVHLVDITPEKHEFLVTVDVTGHPSADEIAAQVCNALDAHFEGTSFGENEEYDAAEWTVDAMDPGNSRKI